MLTDDNLYESIFGNHSVIKKFIQALNERVEGDVWLIQGPKGIGKAKLITYLCSKMLNLKNFDGVDIVNPDFFLIKQEDIGKKFISVDKVRKISQFFSTTSNNYGKIAFIDSISELNHYGHNSLLKVLENLPKYSNVFLIDHMTQHLPATIKSRCKSVYLQPLQNADIYKIIEKKLPISAKELLIFYSELSNGSPGLAIKLFEYNSKDLFDLLCEFINNNENKNITIIDKHFNLLKDTQNKAIFINIFFKLFTNLLIKALKLKSKISPKFLSKKEEEAINKLSKEVSFDNLFMVLEYAQNLNSDINSYNIDIKNSIYATLIKLKNTF